MEQKIKKSQRKPVSSIGFLSGGASRECPRLCGGNCRNAITWLCILSLSEKKMMDSIPCNFLIFNHFLSYSQNVIIIKK